MEKYKKIFLICLFTVIAMLVHYAILFLACRNVTFYKRFVMVLSPYTHILFVHARRLGPIMLANMANIIRVKKYTECESKEFDLYMQLHLPNVIGAAIIFWQMLSQFGKFMPVYSALKPIEEYGILANGLLASLLIPFVLTIVWLVLSIIIIRKTTDKKIE